MAFYNRIGSLISQTNMKTSFPSMLNAIRSMSSSKLFVGGLSYNTNDDSLRDAFSSFGDVTEARVIMERDTQRSWGFGFVSFADSEAASSAKSAMDGQELEGRNIRVSEATEFPPRDNFGIHERTKHIEIDVAKGTVRLHAISSADNTADIFTKALPPGSFRDLVCKLKLV